MPFYYYADAFTEPDGNIAPGKDIGSGLESGLDVIGPGCKALTFDENITPPRFVLQLHDNFNNPAPGWVPKTSGEVEADYPGLLGSS